MREFFFRLGSGLTFFLDLPANTYLINTQESTAEEVGLNGGWLKENMLAMLLDSMAVLC